MSEPSTPSPGGQRPLEYGWFLPTSGDTRAFGDGSSEFPSGMDHFETVTVAAEEAGFEYLLVPVQTLCWEAWITSALIVGRTQRIKPLVAARPGYIQPTLLAKMISTFDQLSGGRICINLIAGASDQEARADGITLSKDERYEVMFDEVALLKKLWAADGAKIDFEGKRHRVEGARCVPPILQKPYPPFYLGGGSETARHMSGQHADVHLFWGDTPESIGRQIGEIREVAAQYGRENELGFGMRLQIVCRDTEEEAWRAAARIVEGTSENWARMIRGLWSASAANTRMKEIADAADGDGRIAPHLWTGLTKVRPGAGVAVVGDPEQVAATLQQFIDVGCHSFCLSGYPHHEEATRFGEVVRPLLDRANVER